MNKSPEINYSYFITLLVLAIVFIFIGFGYGARYNEKQCNLFLLEDIYSMNITECHDFCSNSSGAKYTYDGRVFDVFYSPDNDPMNSHAFNFSFKEVK